MDEMFEALKEAHRCLGSMVFMAEAAEAHEVAYGDIERAKSSRDEIEQLLTRAGEEVP